MPNSAAHSSKVVTASAATTRERQKGMLGCRSLTMTSARNSTAPGAPATANRLTALVDALAHTWPDATCEFDHHNAYQLLVGTILAAQSTDKRVNELTQTFLFKKYRKPEDYLAVPPEELEKDIDAAVAEVESLEAARHFRFGPQAYEKTALSPWKRRISGPYYDAYQAPREPIPT